MSNLERLLTQIEANRTDYDAAAARIKSDRSLTREQRAAELNAKHTVASQHHEELRRQYRDAVIEERERLLKQATTLPSGEDSLSNRDARQRARAARTSMDLRRLAGDAVMDGDKGLQAAVLSEAVERGQLASVSLLPGAQELYQFEEQHGNPSSAQAKLARSFRLRGPAAPSR